MAGFIVAQRQAHQIPYATSCRALSVSQAWFFKWRHGDPSPRHARRAQVKVEIGRLFAAHRGTYGSPRITSDLRAAGWRVSQNTVAALMRQLGLAARRRKKRKQTTRPGRGRWRAPDLIGRDFGTDRLNHTWYGDGTEIPTEEGKLYLDSVLDMGSRRIVGFAIGEHHNAGLARAALRMAVAVRGGKDALTEVLRHTDQGSEYTARAFQAACARVGIKQSMGRAGSALDNPVIESWHSTVEFELRQLEHFTTKTQAHRRVAVWIQEYNHDRRHSSLGMLSPVAYELHLIQHLGDKPHAAASPRLNSRASMMAPSPLASRPRPTGGLWPALTPAPGGTPGRDRERDPTNSGLYGFRGLPGGRRCVASRCRPRPVWGGHIRTTAVA